jgi:endonuclease I
MATCSAGRVELSGVFHLRRGRILVGLRRSQLAIFIIATIVARFAAADDVDYLPPASYYNSATGAGSTLKGQLLTIMSTGQLSRTYGDFRYSAAITDVDPNNANNILLMYSSSIYPNGRSSVPAIWDPNPTADWNREHVWPQAQQPGGDVSNSTTGHKADPFALRPANPGINTSRGNKPYGFEATTGNHGAVSGGYYFPGDLDKGDAARSLFYSDTRYGPSLGISLVDSVPGTNQMGDLSSLIAWNYLDPPDAFERRRNQAIYSSTMNASYYTNNRNAYIDHPEYVWSVYVDQANDSQLSIAGSTINSDGSSTKTVNLSNVIVGGTVPAAQSVTLNKTGFGGTYFSVNASLLATSSMTGRYNAFPIITGPTPADSKTISVGLNTITEASGLRTGTVTIDNLDITAGSNGGVGHAANDANDVITVNLNVLDHALPSFTSPSQSPSQTIDFGNIALGTSAASATIDVFNLNAPSGFTAALDLDSVASSGNTAAFTTNLASFANLAAGASHVFTSSFNVSAVGTFLATYTLSLSDEDLSGATNNTMTLTLKGIARLAGDFNGDGSVDAGDYLVWKRSFGQSVVVAYAGADGNGNLTIDSSDYEVWRAHFGQTASAFGAGASLSGSIPEPATVRLAAISAAFVCHCLRRAR